MTPSTPTDDVLLHGEVKASYFWDDGSGINGDTGAPASGEPMQKGLFAAPSWPLGTKGYVVYEGKTAEFFIGDRGPGDPSQGCDVMLDIDGRTFAELTGESWNDTTYTVTGGAGHIDVEYYITEWGDGNGTPGTPHPFQNPSEPCDSAVSPVPEREEDTGSGAAAAEGGEEPHQEESAPEQEDAAGDAPAEDAGAGQESAPEQEDAESGAQQPPADGGAADTPQDTAEQTTATTAADQPALDLVSNEVPTLSAGLTLAVVVAAGAVVARRVALLARPTGRHHRTS
ncbi:hypothetical protein NI17_002000 [Thermobifida halotolerans]|uniref:Uncharacterized protein n=1 Tax=Thermobifida halotolerans TaxID=483545 RepID=A0A399G8R8_9ACTN|nr:hypothetical protein [Thermobifida halotolerans]UOE20051.1 hypothetical protein NI17_002000 [Thermobifida halotolerans]